MYIVFQIHLIAFIWLIRLVGINCPEVRLNETVINGRFFNTFQGKRYIAYLGVPYADPPRRFERPKPISTKSTKFGWSFIPSCAVYNDTDFINEDCLYLNIFAPWTERYDTRLFPVMVFFQGDSPTELHLGPDHFIHNDIMLITFGYRQGILGFLSTGDSAASGNWGLYDQQMLLEWIRGHIIHFKGDHHKVTLFGQGTGASMIFFHLLSPLSQGSGICDWALERQPFKKAQEIAKEVGCPIGNSLSLIKCLKSASIRDLLRAERKRKIYAHLPFTSTAVVDGNILPDDPRLLLNAGRINKVPIIMGINSEETSYLHTIVSKEIKKHGRYGNIYIEKYLIPPFLEAVTPYTGGFMENILPEILYTYFNGAFATNFHDITKRFVDMSTDAMYTGCIDESLKILANHMRYLYMYVFEHKGVNTMSEFFSPQPKYGMTCSADELFYLFTIRKARTMPFADLKVSARIVTLWTDFAKYGYAPSKFNSEYSAWPEFGSNFSYLRIASDGLSVGVGYKQNQSQLWTSYAQNSWRLWTRPSRPMSVSVYKTLAWAMVAVSLCLVSLLAFLLSVLYYQRHHSSFRSRKKRSATLEAKDRRMSNEISPWLNEVARHTYHTRGDIFTIRQADNVFQKTYSLQFETKLPFRPIIYPSIRRSKGTTEDNPEIFAKADIILTNNDEKIENASQPIDKDNVE